MSEEPLYIDAIAALNAELQMIRQETGRSGGCSGTAAIC